VKLVMLICIVANFINVFEKRLFILLDSYLENENLDDYDDLLVLCVQFLFKSRLFCGIKL